MLDITFNSPFSNRHILEDVRPGVDPSLCEKQRQLKRAKLADSLSNQLLLRPGPLELIKKNILHTDDPVGKYYNLPLKNRTGSCHKYILHTTGPF